MKANELRLGNYFEDQKGRLCTVNKIEVDKGELTAFCIQAINGPATAPDFTPIPLTEKWLTDFGFTENSTGTVRKEYWLKFDIDNKAHFIEVAFPRNITIKVIVYYDEHTYKHIQYVHQLQNLYFALTGEELTRKEAHNEG